LAVTQTLIKEEIDESDYITIQNDETTDNANISQLVFIVRYVKNARINERFMGFIRPSGQCRICNFERIRKYLLTVMLN
jgi:hypothetical protein